MGELIEKSDVYSYGVVFLELLIREKVILFKKFDNERCFIIYFFQKLKEDRLCEIFDNKIMENGVIEQFKEVVNFVRRCLKLKGDDYLR